MEKLWREFDIESKMLDDKIKEIEAETLAICNAILTNPKITNASLLREAGEEVYGRQHDRP